MSEAVLADGIPVWVDLAADDPDAVREFYAGLLGWEFAIGGPEVGHYSRARVDGRDVAGIFPRPEGVPAAWTTYFYADDLDSLSAKAVAAGGSTMGEPFEVPMVGRFGIILDPNYAAFGLWQVEGTMEPAGLQQRYGAVWWENWAADAAKAREFYGSVFGYEAEPLEHMDYVVFSKNGTQVGASGGMGAQSTAPAIWEVYFSTDDVDAACAYTESKGGSVEMPPDDSPYGRLAKCIDPFGAVFKLMTPNLNM